MNRWDEAEKAYLDAIDADPNYKEAIEHLDILLQRQKRIRKDS
jgi:hypothetical protein